MQKEFFNNKKKTVHYDGNIWRLAESKFPAIDEASELGLDCKLHLTDNFYLISSIFCKNNKRYTGIHELTDDERIAYNTGVNLENSEWSKLTVNFHKVMEFLGKRHTNVEVRPRKRAVDFDCNTSNVKMYTWVWQLDGKDVQMDATSSQFYCEDFARSEAQKYFPDKLFNEGDLSCKIKSFSVPTPESTEIMKIVYLKQLFNQIHKLQESDKESDSLEEVEKFEKHFGEAKANIKCSDLISMFDECRKNMGARPVLAQALAKAAKAYLSDSTLKSNLNMGYLFTEKNMPLTVVLSDIEEKWVYVK